MPRFDEGEQNLKLIYGNIVLMGNPDQYGEILAENIFVEDITRSALQTLISNSELVRGKYYRITNAVGSTLSFIVTALTANTIAEMVYNSANGETYKYDITADTAILEPNPIALGTSNQVLGVNNAGTAQEYKTLISTDSSVAITHSANGIDLSVDSISGLAAGGELAGTYPNPTLVNNSVTAKVLQGLSVSGSAIVSTDSILVALGKAQNQINALAGGVNYRGTWNASTNSPALASGVGTQGYYYVVTVAGSTDLDGITDWKLGDWAIYNGTAWQKVDNTDAVVSVNGYMGIVTLSASDVGALPTSAINGTTGIFPIFTGSGTIGDSSLYKSSNTIIAGNTTTGNNFRVVSSSYGNNGIVELYGTDDVLKLQFGTSNATEAYIYGHTGVALNFYTNTISRMLIQADGSIITNQATDTGEHFIVGGSLRANGTALVNMFVADDTLSAFISASGGLYGYYSSGGVLASYSDNSGTLSPLTLDGSNIALRVANTTRASLSSTQLITFGASNTGEAHIFGGSARVNGALGIYGGNNAAFLTAPLADIGFTYANISNSGGNLFIGIARNDGVLFGSGGTAYAGSIGTQTNTDFQIATNNTVRLTIASTGAATFSSSVTVNGATGSVDTKLDVKVSTNNNLGVRTGTSLGTSGTAIQFHNDALSAYTVGAIEASTLLLNSVSGGNVGIGTTTPGSKLSVVGLPTSASGLSAGDIWNDGGTLKIV